MARTIDSLSYSFSPGIASACGCTRRPRAIASNDCVWRRSVPVIMPSKTHALVAKPFAQALALSRAELAQTVVVVGAERGLAVAHEVEVAHASDCRRPRHGPVSQPRPIARAWPVRRCAQCSLVALFRECCDARSQDPRRPGRRPDGGDQPVAGRRGAGGAALRRRWIASTARATACAASSTRTSST